jgi:hypothetical protein
MLAGEADEGLYVCIVFGYGHGHWLFLVNGGVRGIEHAPGVVFRAFIAIEFSMKLGGQRLPGEGSGLVSVALHGW